MDTTPTDDGRRKILREAAKGTGVLLVLVLLMMWLAGAFVGKVEPEAAQPLPPPEKSKTAKVERRSFPLMLDQIGTLRAQTEARVSTRIMAQVKEILVAEGDKVIGGDAGGATPTVLARLEDGDIKARLRQAESQINAMKSGIEAARAKVAAARAQVGSVRANRERVASDYRRYQELRENRAATGQQLESAKAQKDMAEAQVLAARSDVEAAESEIARLQAQKEQAEAAVAEARVALSYTVIQAPFTGQVVRKTINVGDMASPGQPLFFLQASSLPELHAFVSESYLHQLRVGQELNVTIDALNRTFKGKIREVMPSSDPSTRTVMVKVSLPPDPDLVNGLFGRMEIPYGKYETLVVPVSAVREVGQLPLVETVDGEGHRERRFVVLGERHGDLVEILSGLTDNEEVVIP
jgi:multidrug efflux pump subunit AcrA (membrane-fusion protein)